MARTTFKKRILSSPLVHVLGSLLVSLLLRLVYLTSRNRYQFAAASLPYAKSQHPGIFCFWHGRMIMQPFLKPARPMHVLISHHNDGALITATMRWFGIDSVRIARKRGGTPAMRELFAVTEKNENIAITPDGPRGPFQQAAGGAAYVAAKSGYPLIPITFSAERHWRLRSWDRFMIPRFFSRILFIVGEPIFVPHDADDAAQAHATALLQESLVRITAEADAALGVAG